MRSHISSVLIGMAAACALCLSASNPGAAIDPRLIGTWHSIEIRCNDTSQHPSESSVLSVEPTIKPNGGFTWTHYIDLDEPEETCSGHFKSQSPNILEADDSDYCDLDPYDRRLSYEFSRGMLTLSGTEDMGEGPGAVRLPRESFTIHLARGRLDITRKGLAQCSCEGQQPLPPWTQTASPITSKSDLVWFDSGVSEPERLVAASNRLFWKALRAFQGSGGAVALKYFSYSIEGDLTEEYLLVSKGKAVQVSRRNAGIIQDLSTCTCVTHVLKLKAQSPEPGSLWRFISRAPGKSDAVYIAYPVEDGTGTFP